MEHEKEKKEDQSVIVEFLHDKLVGMKKNFNKSALSSKVLG